MFKGGCTVDIEEMFSHMTDKELKTATLAGGCFWCLEAIFESLQGISNIKPGFAGGDTDNPTYKAVCQGDTNHAEVIQFNYDPDIIDYVEIMKIFMTVHNPTTLNQQGNDIGTQYRSAIFYHDEHQQMVAKEIINYLETNKIWQNIVTEVVPFTKFYAAEPEHFSYFKNNPDNRYCQAVINPKVVKFKELFQEKLK